MIHINLNMIFHTHVEHSPSKTIYIKYYKKYKKDNPPCYESQLHLPALDIVSRGLSNFCWKSPSATLKTRAAGEGSHREMMLFVHKRRMHTPLIRSHACCWQPVNPQDLLQRQR